MPSKPLNIENGACPESCGSSRSRDAAPIALIDVHYLEVGAHAACVVANSWSAAVATVEQTVTIPLVKAYQPGRFFERELPCLMQVLALVTPRPAAIIVDGYVVLDDQGSPGWGAHLFERLEGRIPVIGLAKRPYQGSPFAARVTRGSGHAPLFVTARGLDQARAAQLIKSMHGEHRIPTLAKRVDQLVRGIAESRATT